VKGEIMKIVLEFDEMQPDGEALLLAWLRELATDKSPENTTPLRYANSVEVLQEG
jgi:hypothetical protein